MYKKFLVLAMIIFFTNAIAEANKSPQRFQSCDPKQIELDSLAAEDEQLRHLTTEAPFFTAPMKGIIVAASGVGLGVAASFIKDEQISKGLSSMGYIAFMTGAGYAIASGLDNASRRETLTKGLILRNTK